MTWMKPLTPFRSRLRKLNLFAAFSLCLISSFFVFHKLNCQHFSRKFGNRIRAGLYTRRFFGERKKSQSRIFLVGPVPDTYFYVTSIHRLEYDYVDGKCALEHSITSYNHFVFSRTSIF